MVRQVQPEPTTKSDLDSTDELPCLDVAAYEEQLASNTTAAEPVVAAEPPRAAAVVEEPRLPPLQPLPALPAVDTLHDIEAWIAAQDERTHSYERALEEVQKARTEAQARGDTLALELEIAQKALHSALCRANDGERAALDKAAAARASDTRAEQLQSELSEKHAELAARALRLADAGADLERTRATLSAKTQEYDELRQRHEALGKTVDERSTRVAQLEGELVQLNTQLAETRREVAARAERITAIQAVSQTQQHVAADMAREREALSQRVANLLENAQSNAWRRSFWEGMWQDLEEQLADSIGQRERATAEQTELNTALGRLKIALAEREAEIGQLKADSLAQSATLEEVKTTRTRELVEVRTLGATLATDFKALQEKHQDSLTTLSERETQLAELRMARTALEEKLARFTASDAAHLARISELETLAANFGQALQQQTELARQAGEQLSTRERELSELQGRAASLESRLQTSEQQAGEHAARAQSLAASSKEQLTQLSATQQRLRELEQQAQQQGERLTQLQSELAAARTRSGAAEAAQLSSETELAHLRGELTRESERGAALELAQRELTLELERTRGALGERELQVRRLERYASSSAQVLNRIRVGIERGDNVRAPEPPRVSELYAALVPIDDSDAPVLPLGRHTTIGRAPESDVCLHDTSVSRRHAVVTIGLNGAFIEDLRSVNGVKLNRRRVRHARLNDGDVIELGAKLFRFSTTPAAPAAETG
jgi:chromosome segregation ATPase